MSILKNLVLLEDNPADAEMAVMSLSILFPDVEVTHFSEGTQLFTFLENNEDINLSLILLDLNMPSMNGIEVLKCLRKHPVWQYYPVVVFSSSNNHDDITTCYQLGANAFVTKPFDLEKFNVTLEAITNFWVFENITPENKTSMISI